MKLRSYEAPDSRTAMKQIRQEQGDEAVIISSEALPCGGVRIVAATDFDASLLPPAPRGPAVQKSDAPARIPAPVTGKPFNMQALPVEMRRALASGQGGYAQQAAPRRGGFTAFVSSVTSATLSGARRLGSRGSASPKAGPPFREPASPAPALSPSPSMSLSPGIHLVAGTDTVAPEVVKMREELGSMRRMIERQLGQLSEDRLRGCPGRAAAMDLLLDFGCPPAMASRLAADLDPDLAPGKVVPAVRAMLEHVIQSVEHDPLRDGGVIALVGPTGAGKTTTAAKLAARFAARHSARDVALVTTDQHRAAAREQLHAHGRRLGITVLEAEGADSLPRMLGQLADYPLVIIDTAGISPRDKALISQLNIIRETAQVRTLLVLPANGNAQDLSDLVRTYSSVRPDSVVLTKVDETARLGGALSAAVDNALQIAFICNGQGVPHDIELCSSTALAGRIDDVPLRDPPHDEKSHAAA